MISVITAIHNQLSINRLYYEYLKKYTHHPFELIIIDNGSTDGSAAFFKSVGATVIENSVNYSYPYSQNQGIDVAKYPILAFLNNDIIVPPNWDLHFLNTMAKHQLDIITCCGIEEVETPEKTRLNKNRWKRIKNILNVLPFSWKYRLMHRLMYDNWEQFSEKRYQTFKEQVKVGVVGNSVLMTRRALELLGPFDPRIQAADHDLFVRSLMRYKQHQDIKPIHLALDVFIHHFIRMTLKASPPVFADADQLIPFVDKWDKTLHEYWAEGQRLLQEAETEVV